MDALASDPDQLIAALNELLLHNTMSEEMEHIVRDAIASIPAANRRLRVRTAIYLIATSPCTKSSVKRSITWHSHGERLSGIA